jgi:predicted secreted protein
LMRAVDELRRATRTVSVHTQPEESVKMAMNVEGAPDNARVCKHESQATFARGNHRTLRTPTPAVRASYTESEAEQTLITGAPAIFTLGRGITLTTTLSSELQPSVV